MGNNGRVRFVPDAVTFRCACRTQSMRCAHRLPAKIIRVENSGCTTVVIEIRTMRTEPVLRHDKFPHVDDFLESRSDASLSFG